MAKKQINYCNSLFVDQLMKNKALRTESQTIKNLIIIAVGVAYNNT